MVALVALHLCNLLVDGKSGLYGWRSKLTCSLDSDTALYDVVGARSLFCSLYFICVRWSPRQLNELKDASKLDIETVMCREVLEEVVVRASPGDRDVDGHPTRQIGKGCGCAKPTPTRTHWLTPIDVDLLLSRLSQLHQRKQRIQGQP